MTFSLSPSVDIAENNQSFNVPNIPTTNTGMVLRADAGPAFQIVNIPTDKELEIRFDTPTKYNFVDWYNAWNFNQYGQSLSAVRPIDQGKITKNTAIALAGGDADTSSSGADSVLITAQGFDNADLYNDDIASTTLDSLVVDSVTKVLGRFTEASGVYTFTGAENFLSILEGTQLLQTGTSGVLTSGGTDVITITGTSTAVWESGQQPAGWSSSLTITADSSGWFLTGIVTNIRLAFFNKYVKNEQNIGVAVCSNNASWGENVSTDIASTFSSFFEFRPDFASSEFAVIVFRQNDDNTFTDVEKWVVSYSATGRDQYNRLNYAEEVFNNSSDYLYCKVSTASSDNVNTGAGPLPMLHHSHYNSIYPRIGAGTVADTFPATSATANGAYDANGYVTADVDEAFDMYSDADTVNINILLNHPTSINKAGNIASSRKDCIALTGYWDETDLVGKTPTIATANVTDDYGTIDASDVAVYTVHDTYSAVYGNMKYQYDKFNDTNRWMSLLGDAAGLMAETDESNDPWWAPAGINRGSMKNVIKLAYNPNKANRDSLYVNSINPVMSIPGEGQGLIMGQKTATSVASAIDRVNVRRLLIHIEKSVATALRPFMFEFNDDETRNRIAGVLNPFLAEIKARRGLFDFLVVVDSTNNTSEIIDQNALVVDIFLKPSKVAEFIKVNVVITKTGTEFAELIASP